MKLKKIAALALAGVMAVSMLAGCANKGTDDKKDPTDTTNSVTAAAVMAQLNADVTKKVTFQSSTTLENTLKKATQNVVDAKGVNNASEDWAADITKEIVALDKTLGTDKVMPYIEGASEDTAKTVAKEKPIVTVVAFENANDAYTPGYIGKKLAENMEKAEVGSRDDYKTLSELNLKSNKYTLSSGKDAVLNFTYTGNVAVVNVGDTYFVAFTVSRTATQVVSNL